MHVMRRNYRILSIAQRGLFKLIEVLSMSESYSIQLTDHDAKLAFRLIENGQFADLNAIVQRGMELVREENEMQPPDVEGLKALLDRRRKGKFISNAEGRRRTERMLSRKKAEHGLSD